jgi:hypothetical protein
MTWGGFLLTKAHFFAIMSGDFERPFYGFNPDSTEFPMLQSPAHSSRADAFGALEVEVKDILSSFFRSIDPNWVSGCLSFTRGEPSPPPQEFLPSRARMNCPSKGDVDLLPLLEDILGRERLALLREHAEEKPTSWWLAVANPQHEIKLLPDKTQILFEHCTSAMVVEVAPTGGVFFIQHDRDRISEGEPVIEQYSLDRLVRELSSHALGVACAVEYGPFLPRE